MFSKKPTVFDTWIGGYLGPSYRLQLSEDRLHYQVFERAYEPFAEETISPTEHDWARFLDSAARSGLWEWDRVYQGEETPDSTTWYVTLSVPGRSIESRGLNRYPPGFVDFMRSVRVLIEGRQFS